MLKARLTFLLVWLLGFIALLVFDLLMELFVFEWLNWNGTDKNDWFFMLWWCVVPVWFLYGTMQLFKEK
jgi:hypothetical protein